MQEIKLSQDECTKIAQAFTARDFTTFQSNGVMIEGQKYQFLSQQDNKVVFAKKKDSGSVTMQSTKQGMFALIIWFTF